MKQIAGIVVFLFFAINTVVLRAQSQQPIINPAAYKSAIEAELSTSPRERFLYERADAYPRLVHIRAMKRLGYDIAKLGNEMPEMPESQLPDTGITANISKTVSDQDETTISI